MDICDLLEIMNLVDKYAQERIDKETISGSAWFFIRPELTREKIIQKIRTIMERKNEQ